MNESLQELTDAGFNIVEERKATAKGARLLDKILPGWYKQINLGKLQMDNGSLCMLGQLFGRGVEGRLAKEMYPEELLAPHAAVFDGYFIAEAYNGTGILKTILCKLGLTGNKEKNELLALRHVCRGHNTKCLWAEEIASRLAKDACQSRSGQ